MKIVLGSSNKLKINAVNNAFADVQAEIIGVKVTSDVPEQPEGDKTLTGARNRANHALALIPDADIVIGIENGIFKQDDSSYVDKAVIYCLLKSENYQTPHVHYSDSVQFDTACVEAARKRGFDKTTVGITLWENNRVSDPKDPHLSLTGKPRASFLTAALIKLAQEVLTPPQVSSCNIRP